MLVPLTALHTTCKMSNSQLTRNLLAYFQLWVVRNLHVAWKPVQAEKLSNLHLLLVYRRHYSTQTTKFTKLASFVQSARLLTAREVHVSRTLCVACDIASHYPVRANLRRVRWYGRFLGHKVFPRSWCCSNQTECMVLVQELEIWAGDCGPPVDDWQAGPGTTFQLFWPQAQHEQGGRMHYAGFCARFAVRCTSRVSGRSAG